MANMARRLVDAGADGLVLFNRFYQPDLDLDALEVTPNLELSSPTSCVWSCGGWPSSTAGRRRSLAATTGVHTAEEAIKVILAGADVTMMASALLRNGRHRPMSVRRNSCRQVPATTTHSGTVTRTRRAGSRVTSPPAPPR
jgi:dihydroorotate dehydrogenase